MGTFWLYLTGKATGTTVGLLAGAQSSPADSLKIMATFFLGMIIIIFGVDLFFSKMKDGNEHVFRGPVIRLSIMLAVYAAIMGLLYFSMIQ